MFEHPTKKVPRKVILVGLGPTKTEYMNIMASDAAVIDRDEVWGVNAAGGVIKVDVSFAMDDYLICQGRTPAFAKYFETAQEPVITSVPRTDGALAYPLQEVMSMPGARPYFNGSVSYVAAYAAWLGVKELTIFGCDYIYGGATFAHPRQADTVSRYYACMSYWLGYCQGRGMDVVVCPTSPLLDSDLTILEQFYGYIVKPQLARSAPTAEPHLGGHMGRCHIDHGALDYLVKRFNVKTMVDVGCGTGGMVEYAHDVFGLDACGVDGDGTVRRRAPVVVHDYTTGPGEINGEVDLGWSVEFVEHVEEKYIANYMATLKKCRIVCMTFAPPGTPGHHHVNCQDRDYWIRVFAENGFALNEEATAGVRDASTMGRDFMRQNGLVFRRI